MTNAGNATPWLLRGRNNLKGEPQEKLVVRLGRQEQNAHNGGYTGDVLGLYKDDGKEHGNYRDYRAFIGVILGMYWGYIGNNGKENGNYRDYKAFIGVIQGMYWGYIGMMEKNMETTGIMGPL